MTITIRRPASGQRVAIAMGLAAILLLATFAIVQNRTVDPTATRAANVPAGAVTSQSATYWKQLQSIQDNFLVPAAVAQRSAYWAHLERVQDGFLPPVAGSNAFGYWARLQAVQDGFLPSATVVEPSGLDDTRVSQPR